MHLAVGDVLAQPGAAAHPGPQPPLAAPVAAGRGQVGTDSSASRTAVTARMCASLASAGGAGVYRRPHAARPARVSHVHGPPGPNRAVSA